MTASDEARTDTSSTNALVWVVVLAPTAALLVTFGVQRLPVTLKDADSSAWEIFFGVVGFIYAILAGLLIADLLRRFNRLSTVIRSEANCLASITDALNMQPDSPIVPKVEDSVRTYAYEVVHEEWPRMQREAPAAGPDPPQSKMRTLYPGVESMTSLLVDRAVQRRRAERMETVDNARRELYAAVSKVEDTAPASDIEKLVLQITVTNATELGRLRTERLQLSGEALPWIARWTLYLLSVTLIAGFALVPVGSPLLHPLMVFAITAAIVMLNAMIHDLDRPLDGIWRVSAQPFRLIAIG